MVNRKLKTNQVTQYKFDNIFISIPKGLPLFLFTGTSMDAVSVIFGLQRPTTAGVSWNHIEDKSKFICLQNSTIDKVVETKVNIPHYNYEQYFFFQNVCYGTLDSIVRQNVLILQTETNARDTVTVAKTHAMFLWDV